MHAAACAARVAFDQDRQWLIRAEGGSVALDDFGAVSGDAQLHAPVQPDQAGELGCPHDVVGQEDVGEASIGHDFGLAELLDRYADGAQFNLPAGETRELVGLDMWAKAVAIGVRMRLGAGEVGLDARDVDQHARRF